MKEKKISKSRLISRAFTLRLLQQLNKVNYVKLIHEHSRGRYREVAKLVMESRLAYYTVIKGIGQ